MNEKNLPWIIVGVGVAWLLYQQMHPSQAASSAGGPTPSPALNPGSVAGMSGVGLDMDADHSIGFNDDYDEVNSNDDIAEDSMS